MFTYVIYFSNKPVLNKYIDQGIYALRYQFLDILYKLENKCHRSCMNTFHNHAKFFKDSWNYTKFIMVSGVTRKGLYGIPDCIMYGECTTPIAVAQAPGIIKDYVLKN